MADAATLRAVLSDLADRPTPIDGHLGAVSFATVGIVEARAGRLEQARRDLARAYELGVATDDMPILSSVGVAVATLAALLGRDVEAARILGASTRVRGADDPTAPALRWVDADLRARMGATFDAAYAEGLALSRDDAAAGLDPALLA